jgi:ribosomal protein S18 acetylase RimI-like enzyme
MTSSEQVVPLRKIGPADFKAVADMMGRAFDDDPVVNFLAKQDGERSARIRHFMDVALQKMTFPYGETYVREDFRGAAFWNPPGELPHGLRFNRGIARALSTFDFLEKRHPKAPHYYLLAIGVDPDHQGKGIGSAMLQPMVERLDREGAPSYLESSKDRNVPLYERFGYRVVEEVRLPKGGPPVWLMWREPQ